MEIGLQNNFFWCQEIFSWISSLNMCAKAYKRRIMQLIRKKGFSRIDFKAKSTPYGHADSVGVNREIFLTINIT